MLRAIVRSLPFQACLLAGVAALAAPQSTAPASPPAAYSVGVAYDTHRGRLVTFGGFTGRYVGDTWEWDGSTWTPAQQSGPSARNAPALAYDEARRQVVLFGGDTKATGALGDTWLYDGETWRQAASTGPPARTTHAMVYDSRRERVLLFGGSAGTTVFGDTWEWDGKAWSQVASSGPDARTLHGLAYDRSRGRAVLFGGTAVLAPDAPSFGDTWEWDGSRWTRVNVTGPSARDHVAMGFDPERRAVVLQGGGLGDVDPGETWTFDGRAWSRASADGPRKRFAKIVHDPRAGALLLYGGYDRTPTNELWRWTGTGWIRVR